VILKLNFQLALLQFSVSHDPSEFQYADISYQFWKQFCCSRFFIYFLETHDTHCFWILCWMESL